MKCRDNLGIHEFDIAMKNVFIGLAHDLVVDRFISKVRVKRKSSRFAIYTDKQHHGISADLLERELGTVLDKANRTIQ